MALNRKYANLPDLDLSAPDIYETPELTDDNSTIPTTAARTQSDDEFYDVEDDTEGISHSRLRIGDARSRFEPATVDTAGVDFSDRVDVKRKSYKASSRRQRILQDGTTELGDLSDDDDEESLERRIARLTREVQEAKDEYAKLKASPDTDAQGDTRLQSLSDLLASMSMPTGTTHETVPAKTTPTDKEATEEVESSTYTITYAPTYEQTHALAKAADFDRRLLALEKGLGISSSLSAEAGEGGLPRAILPTLDTMNKQVATLAQASTANLDAISRRVRTLASDQDKLNDAREKARALREELGKGSSSSSSSSSSAGAGGGPQQQQQQQQQQQPAEGAEQETKINALYGVLPTIEGLAPLLPPLLDRLRSLRAIHADAAAAAHTLEQVEQRQAETAAELRQWREGLQRLEETIKEGGDTVKGNLAVMEGWIKDLEARMDKLA
ncbi:Dynamitin subunit 2 [Cordyceps fumosorosea ARSEF 2679]|uniref:Dynamitin subunit 2 n=1 Tax=Cordyceps fumosorosea (strain ARSEF 2679) TaxID=1081104 RepID=A0A167XHR8_CORFA|nr:Dynamitin subunit 2 [Cordyceps fumosorosea ARSEF 2679]OAA64991.1 Dynamitin subunit 2 [Cordyceps fumosorosea ARSEF 2679]